MLNRRDFIRALTAGGTLFALEPLSVFSRSIEKGERGLVVDTAVYQSPFQQAVWRDVDVLVVGATSGGVAAAIAAREMGARVFVVSSFPYMGEDICGRFRYWPKRHKSESALFERLFPSAIAPTPLWVKSELENNLIGRGVEFVYCSFVTNVLRDGEGRLAGVCIGNRSGRQLIRAKVVIDATLEASVARLADAPFYPFEAGEQTFRFVAVDGEPHKNALIVNTRRIFPAFNVGGKSHTAWEYQIKLPLRENTSSTWMEIEQQIRDLTWDVGLTDSSDILDYIPTDYLRSRNPFQVDEQTNLFVLGPCSSIPRDQVEEFMEPAVYMERGEEVGRRAAQRSKECVTPRDLTIIPLLSDGQRFGEISFYASFRPCPPLEIAAYPGGALPVIGDYDVVVVGGGTAGAPAAISAARAGVHTLLLEYLHGLGGIGTMGMIGRYTVGYRKGFTAEIDEAMRTIAPKGHPRYIRADSAEWPLDWKAEWYRREARKEGADVWFHAIGGGVVKDGNSVVGVIVLTPFGQGVVRCRRVIDATGSADVAIAAGAAFEQTGRESLAVQGAGLAKYDPGDHYNNTDWTFVDDTDIIDVTRLFIQGKQKNYGSYDIGKLPQTRERRRVLADLNVSVFDMMNRRTYHDTISYHVSNFDTHGFTEDIYFAIRPPVGSHENFSVKLPLRSLLPKELDNVLVTGLGCGAHRDAMPVIRMQPDLQNQGYAAGLVAAESVRQAIPLRHLDMRAIQRKLVAKGNLPAEILTEEDGYQLSDRELQEAVLSLPDGYRGLERVLAFPERSLSFLRQQYRRTSEKEKVCYATVLCMLGKETGWDVLLKKVADFRNWDAGWNYRGMHQFGASSSELDCYVMALGRSGRKETVSELLRLSALLTPESEFSHIRAISVAAGSLRSEAFAVALARLLRVEGMMGHHLADQQEARLKIKPNIIDGVFTLEDSARNAALKELYLAKALYLSGDDGGIGKQVLERYSIAQEGHYARFAREVLAG